MNAKPVVNQDTARYIDREISWIAFNDRVLREGMDESNPILERLKFLGIVSSNFDEFFMVRVAGLMGSTALKDQVCRKARSIMESEYAYFENVLLPEMTKSGFKRVRPVELDDLQKTHLQRLFTNEWSALLTPVALHEEGRFPLLANLQLYVALLLNKPSEENGARYGVVEVPKSIPRIVFLPSDKIFSYMLIEDVVAMFAGELFSGFEIRDHGFLRVTRAAELTLDEEKDEDFANVVTEALKQQRENTVVRLETHMPDGMQAFFESHLCTPSSETWRVSPWLDLKSISLLAYQPGFEAYTRPVWVPQPSDAVEAAGSMFDLLKADDVWLHHPYESFDTFIRFLSEAAEDRHVLAVKQTLYRTAGDSMVISALERAAENGKKVTVVVELKARFDESSNIQWARRLERAGATVLYGVAGLKVHGKATLVVRREPEGIKRYVHIGTGNYNEKTAGLYSDIGYFTSEEAVARDVSSFFNIVTGYSHPVAMSRIDISPYSLRARLKRLIMREVMRTKKDVPGLIIIKMNSLVDRELIDALYRASASGVRVQLIVRGICCLRAGVPGLSENIEVRSIVDRFLEHSRIFYFENGGEQEIYLSSADWMPRNMDRRIEMMFSIENKRIRKQFLELLKSYLKDNTKSWRLGPDDRYEKMPVGEKERKFRIQEYLCRKANRSYSAQDKPAPIELKPQRPQPALKKGLRIINPTKHL